MTNRSEYKQPYKSLETMSNLPTFEEKIKCKKIFEFIVKNINSILFLSAQCKSYLDIPPAIWETFHVLINTFKGDILCQSKNIISLRKSSFKRQGRLFNF